MVTYWLNSFHPLCENKVGLEAIAVHSHPPFIDASCRREPDFEHTFPSISALCRAGKFAPKLKAGDIVTYMTVGGRVRPYKLGHHLVSILQVEHVYKTHDDAHDWYKAQGLPIPSNCMVADNPPFSFDHTAGNFENSKSLKDYLSYTPARKAISGARRVVIWDGHYLKRANKWPSFIRTKCLYRNLTDPPLIDSDLDDIFGGIPYTLRPKPISASQLKQLAAIVGIDLPT